MSAEQQEALFTARILGEEIDSSDPVPEGNAEEIQMVADTLKKAFSNETELRFSEAERAELLRKTVDAVSDQEEKVIKHDFMSKSSKFLTLTAIAACLLGMVDQSPVVQFAATSGPGRTSSGDGDRVCAPK